MSDNNKLLSIFKQSDENPDKEAREEMEQIWKYISRADAAESLHISEQKVDEALKKVQKRIQSGNQVKKGQNRFSYFRYAAAAAVLLIAVGLAYTLMPVTVTVPRGETQIVTLPDESTIELNSGSEISYSRLFGIWGREVSLQGEAFFDVRPDGSMFTVTTDNAEISVLGTKFNVRYWPSEINNRTSVFLVEGAVNFSSLLTDNNSITLEAGQQSWVSSEQPQPADPVTADQEKALAWQHNSIAFENQPLSSIFAELERRFDVNINGHPDIMDNKITIYLSGIENAESAIKDICRAQGLIYKEQNRKFLIFRN